MPDPSIMELVLAELKQIRESLHDMRVEINGKLGSHATQLATIQQWIAGHDKGTSEQSVIVAHNLERITHLEEQRNEQRGAITALRWVGATTIGLIGLLEAWLHRGQP